MGNVSFQLLQKGHEVLFAFEEAIGYMFGTSVLDKDGVSAAAVMAECAVWLYANGKTFASQLEACYQRWVESGTNRGRASLTGRGGASREIHVVTIYLGIIGGGGVRHGCCFKLLLQL